MEEETVDEQLQEMLAPEQEDVQIDESTEETVKDQAQEPTPPEDDMQAARFSTLRQNNKQLEEQNQALNQRLEALERAQKPTPQQNTQEQYTEAVLAPDDFVEGKHLSKYDQRLNKMSKELSEYKKQVHMNSVDMQIKSKYPDFDHVVTKENMQVLHTAYPELATTIATSQDLYSQATSAYTLIKKLGIIPSDDTVRNAQRIANNSEKPIPTGSVHSQATSDSPLSFANSFAEEMTPEVKSKIWKELQANARQSK